MPEFNRTILKGLNPRVKEFESDGARIWKTRKFDFLTIVAQSIHARKSPQRHFCGSLSSYQPIPNCRRNSESRILAENSVIYLDGTRIFTE